MCPPPGTRSVAPRTPQLSPHPMHQKSPAHNHTQDTLHIGGTKCPSRFPGPITTATELRACPPPSCRGILSPITLFLLVCHPPAQTHRTTRAPSPWKSTCPNSAHIMTSAIHTPCTARHATHTDDGAPPLGPHYLHPNTIPLHRFLPGSDHGHSNDHNERSKPHTPSHANSQWWD